MGLISRDRKTELRAAILSVALLVGLVSASAALAASSQDECSMTCCVQAGHCCCSPRHAFVHGQPRGNEPELATAQISTSCPEGCATSRTSSQFHSRSAVRVAQGATEQRTGAGFFSPGRPAGYSFIAEDSSPPDVDKMIHAGARGGRD